MTDPQKHDRQENKPISRVMMIIEEFRKLDPEMTMNIAVTLLVIAERPGINFAELMKRTGL